MSGAGEDRRSLPRRPGGSRALATGLGTCVHIAALLCTYPALAQEPAAPPSPPPAATTEAPSKPAAAEPAQEAPDPAADAGADPKVIEVRVIGAAADALQKIPGSGQLLTKKDVDRAAPQDVSELLRRVPGLTVRQEQGAGLRLDISVRGLDGTRSRRVLVLEDGVPAAINPYGEPDLYYSPPFERVRGIEVVKGSGSVLFGPQTIGGVVQLLTHAPPASRRVYVWMNGGMPGQFELLGRYGDAWGDVRYIAQVFGKRGDGVRGESYHATDAFAKIAVPVSARSEITAKIAFHDESATSTDVGLTRAMFERDPRRPTIAPFDQVHVQRFDASAQHRMWLGEGVTLSTLAYVTSTSRVWRRQDYDRIPQPGFTYERIVGDPAEELGAIYFRDTNTVRDRRYSVIGVEPRLSYRFTTGSVEHSLDAGARFLTETANRQQRRGETPLSEAGALLSDEENGTLAVAGYVQDRIAFTENLLVTPGIRFEYASSKRSIRRTLVQTVPRDVSKDVAIEGTSSLFQPIPGLGLVVGTPRLHGFGGLHLGFAPPRLTTAIRDNGVDEQLAAERAVHYEAGLRAAPWPSLKAEATFFLSNFENQIIPATRAGSVTTDLVNGGRTRHIGGEAAVRFEAGRAFRLPLAVDLFASYTLLSATFVGSEADAQKPEEERLDGKTLPYAPQQSMSAVLDVEHPIGLGAQASWTYVGPQFSDERNTEEVDVTGRRGKIPGYHALDFNLRYTHKGTGLGATLAVKNALDEIYVVSRRPDGIFPAGFRQIIGSVSWRYDEEPAAR